MNNSDNKIMYRDYQESLRFFGISSSFTMEDIEEKRYDMLSHGEDINIIETNYKKLVTAVLSFTNVNYPMYDGNTLLEPYFKKYKVSILARFTKKYNKKADELKSKHNVDVLKNMVQEYYEKLQNATSENISIILNEFYTKYKNKYNEIANKNITNEKLFLDIMLYIGKKQIAIKDKYPTEYMDFAQLLNELYTSAKSEATVKEIKTDEEYKRIFNEIADRIDSRINELEKNKNRDLKIINPNRR